MRAISWLTPHIANAAVQTAKVSPAGFDQPGTRCPSTSTATASSRGERQRRPRPAGTSRRPPRRTPTAAVPACPIAEHHHEPSARSSPAIIAQASPAGTRICEPPAPGRIHEKTARYDAANATVATQADPAGAPRSARPTRCRQAVAERVDEEDQPDRGEQHAEAAGPPVAGGPAAGRPCCGWTVISAHGSAPALRPGPCPCSSATPRRRRRRPARPRR